MALSAEEAKRYARHIVLKGVGGRGQQKLKAARVLVIGAGGLGSPAIAYLAAAGVGHLSIADFDRVSLSNLQRQIVHRSADIGQFKVDSAARFVDALNDHVHVTVVRDRLADYEDAFTIAGAHDLVLDGSDNFETRQLVARACEKAKAPLVSGAVSMFDGQVTVFAPHLDPANPRFADLYPETPNPGSLPSCEAVGVLGATTGVIGTLMAMEAIKAITGVGNGLIGRLLLYDGRAARFSEIKYRRRA